MPRKPKTTVDDEPITLPAVVAVTARADWSDWSQDRERRRIEAEIEQRRQAEERAIYPREIEERIAEDGSRQYLPNWRRLRDEHRRLFVDLLKQTPELQQPELRRLDSLLRMISDNLPPALRPLGNDLRMLLELRIIGHEAAAFGVGIAIGRRLEHMYVDSKGRLRKSRNAPGPGLRIHLDE